MSWKSYSKPAFAVLNSGKSCTWGKLPSFLYRQLYRLHKLSKDKSPQTGNVSKVKAPLTYRRVFLRNCALPLNVHVPQFCAHLSSSNASPIFASLLQLTKSEDRGHYRNDSSLVLSEVHAIFTRIKKAGKSL